MNSGLDREEIFTSNAPAVTPGVPHAQGLRINNLLQTSGQVGVDPTTGKVVEGGVEAQAEQTLLNVQAILNAGGADFAHVLMMRVYLTDPSHFSELNAAYRRVVGDNPAPRTTVCVELPSDLLIEVDALAVI